MKLIVYCCFWIYLIAVREQHHPAQPHIDDQLAPAQHIQETQD